jgi:glutathione S-transferase
MIVLHHLNNSRSQRVLWMLEELALPYRIERYQRDPVTMLAPPELRRVHPLGKSPVIEDEGAVLAESGAILEYLAERHGGNRGLLPAPGTPERERCRYWMHYAEGSAMPPLLLSLVFSRIERGPMPFFVRPIARGIVRRVRAGFIDPQLRLHLQYLESELARAPWFAGADFSIADIQMSFVLEAFAARGGMDARCAHAQDWLARIHARPAYVRAMQQGGPFELLR